MRWPWQHQPTPTAADTAWLQEHGQLMRHTGTTPHGDDCALTRRHYADLVRDHNRDKALLHDQDGYIARLEHDIDRLRHRCHTLQAEVDRVRAQRLHGPTPEPSGVTPHATLAPPPR